MSLLLHPPYALYVLTRRGHELARRLADALPVRLYMVSSLRTADEEPLPPDIEWFDRLFPLVEKTFHCHACHIFITAAGVAVRAIAPLLSSKARDPAVLVMDHRGEFVISLLSGHLGGGNAEARRIAEILSATPVITTATDLEGLPAIDLLAKERGLVIENIAAAKDVSSALLAGSVVFLDDPGNELGLKGSSWEGLFPPLPREDAASVFADRISTVVLVTPYQPFCAGNLPEKTLLLRPKVLHAGVGCRRGTPPKTIFDAINRVFADNKLSLASLAALASHEAKADEEGLRILAQRLAVPFRTFNTNTLSAYPVSRASPKVRERFGIDGVCEPAALASACLDASSHTLLVPKQIIDGVTIAVACRRPVFPFFSSFTKNIS